MEEGVTNQLLKSGNKTIIEYLPIRQHANERQFNRQFQTIF